MRVVCLVLYEWDCVYDVCATLLTWSFIFYWVGMKWKPHGFLGLSWGICAFDLVNIDYNPYKQS